MLEVFTAPDPQIHLGLLTPQPAGLQAVTRTHPASAHTLNTAAGFPETQDQLLLAVRDLCLAASPSQPQTQFANLSQSHGVGVLGLL